MKRVAIYTRISTSDARQDKDLQLTPLEAYVKSRGWDLYKVYSDEESGGKESRPGLDQLMLDAHKRLFDCCIVWKFDRFSRSTKQLVTALDTFGELGVDFISYSEAIDTTTSAGKMVFSMIAAVAEFERNIIHERVRAGLANARAKGRILGRPRACINMKLIMKLKNEGVSTRQISKQLGIPRSTIQKHLLKI